MTIRLGIQWLSRLKVLLRISPAPARVLRSVTCTKYSVSVDVTALHHTRLCETDGSTDLPHTGTSSKLSVHLPRAVKPCCPAEQVLPLHGHTLLLKGLMIPHCLPMVFVRCRRKHWAATPFSDLHLHSVLYVLVYSSSPASSPSYEDNNFSICSKISCRFRSKASKAILDVPIGTCSAPFANPANAYSSHQTP